VFETRRQVGIEIVRPLPTGLTLIGTFLILMLAMSAYGDKITARAAVRDAKRRLFGEKERALVTLQAIADAVITLDSHGRVQFINPVAEKMFGIEHYQGDHPTNSVDCGRLHGDVRGWFIRNRSGRPLDSHRCIPSAGHCPLA
jgi:PAS domain-containing protein